MLCDEPGVLNPRLGGERGRCDAAAARALVQPANRASFRGKAGRERCPAPARGSGCSPVSLTMPLGMANPYEMHLSAAGARQQNLRMPVPRGTKRVRTEMVGDGASIICAPSA